MADRNPSQYGTFLDLRTRPARDLAQRVNLTAPRQIIDLGCGPGNSTAVCAERWPAAEILGLDSSPEMVESARAAQPSRRWAVGDIGEWIRQPLKSAERVDLIFSSAALGGIRLSNSFAFGGFEHLAVRKGDAGYVWRAGEGALGHTWVDRRSEPYTGARGHANIGCRFERASLGRPSAIGRGEGRVRQCSELCGERTRRIHHAFLDLRPRPSNSSWSRLSAALQ